jgi:hypothetical protein
VDEVCDGVAGARRCLHDLRHRVLELVGVDQHPRRRVGDDAGQFAPVQPPVERGVDCAQFAARVEEIQVLHAVLRQDRHTVAIADAGFAPQPVGQPVDAAVPRSEGQPQFRRLPRIDDRQLLRRIDLPPPQIVADVHLRLPQI